MNIKKCLERDGCYDLEDPVAGERFKDLEDRGRRFVTPYGIDFLKVIVLNPRIRRIWREFYKRVTLGHSLIYSEKPTRIYSFSRGGPGTFFIPAVHLCSKGSVVEYWIGSQNHRLPILKSNEENQPVEPLLEYAESSLVNANCDRRRLVFKNSALYVGFYVLLYKLILDRVLVDARIAFTLTKNDVLFNVFFPDNLIPPPPMILNK
ncbi:hypothetical protein F4808DRAFT_259919 [Astrocystis sublimbata]|nr:hypothetical protein F4808DRAFT_259919 [Astrocystis sublimbata]